MITSLVFISYNATVSSQHWLHLHCMAGWAGVVLAGVSVVRPPDPRPGDARVNIKTLRGSTHRVSSN